MVWCGMVRICGLVRCGQHVCGLVGLVVNNLKKLLIFQKIFLAFSSLSFTFFSMQNHLVMSCAIKSAK